MTYRFGVAFRLLHYRCSACGFVEVVWNSRDGRVLEVIDCAVATTTCVYQYKGGGGDTYVERVDSWFRLVAVGHDPGMLSARCGGCAALDHIRELASVVVEGWTGRDEDYRPQHDPLPSERYFRDGTPAEARGIFRGRVRRGEYKNPDGSDRVFSPDEIACRMRGISGLPDGGTEIEFAPGWPLLVVRGSDADTLPVRKEP